MKQQKNTIQEIQSAWPGGLDSFFGQSSLQKAADLFSEMQKPILRPVLLGITPRLFAHWKNNLPIKRQKQERKKFSFYDIVWSRMVQQLIEANYNLAKIAIVLTQLQKPINLKGVLNKKDKIELLISQSQLSKEQREQLLNLLSPAALENTPPIEINLLHVLIMECIIKKLPLSLAIFADCSIMVIDNTKAFLYSEAEKQKLFFQPHIVIPIAGIIREFLASENSAFVLPHISLLPPAESKLFEYIHGGKYESITIHFKDKKIKDVELKKSMDIKSRIVDLLHSGDFGHITIKKHKGEIVKIENTTKVTL